MTRRAPSTPPPVRAASEPLERPPVEELPELTWARVERRLWAELDRAPSAAEPVPAVASRRTWRWPALAVASLAAAALIAVWAWPSEKRTFTSSTSRVVTAEAATEVSFGDAAITVAPTSALLLQGHVDRGVAIVLERGSATFSVAPRSGRPPFMVLAGAVQVRVIGTRFTVTRSGDDARVDVAHGEVEVVARGRREVLLAGASWSSDGVREAAVGGPAPVANPDGVAAAHLSPPPELPAATTGPSSTTPLAPPRATRPRSGSVTDRIPPADEPREIAPPEVRADDPKSMFEAAAALEPSDPGRAQRLYRKVADGTSQWAANATYAAARLAFVKGDRVVAAGYARRYLARFPDGPSADDARALFERATNGASK